MRLLALLALLISVTAAADIVAGSPKEKPTGSTSTASDLIVKLGTNSSVHFYLSGERATSVEMSVAGHRSVFQLDTCVLSREIRVEGMELERDDLREGEHRSRAVTLMFDVGSEKDRRFGKLPRAQLTWMQDRLMVAAQHHKIAPNEETTSPLCYPDVQPNTSLERTRD